MGDSGVIGVIYIDEKEDYLPPSSSSLHPADGYNDTLQPVVNSSRSINGTEPQDQIGGQAADGQMIFATSVLVVACLFLILISTCFLVICCAWRKQKRNSSKSKTIIDSYLAGFEENDVQVKKSPLGGWNVAHRKELAGRNGDTTHMDSSSNDADSSSVASLTTRGSISSLTTSTYSIVGTMPVYKRHLKLKKQISMRSLSTDPTQIVSNRDQLRIENAGIYVGTNHLRKGEDIKSFRKTNFSPKDIQIEKSPRTEDSFSVNYSNQLAKDFNEFDNGPDTIDFYPVGEDRDRESASQCLFGDDHCACSHVDEEIGLTCQQYEHSQHSHPWDEFSTVQSNDVTERSPSVGQETIISI